MTEVVHPVDAGRLRHEVKAKYREVAQEPTADFHFHTGRAHALRLGYPISPLDQLPEAACEAFAGVANPFLWDHPSPASRSWTSARALAWMPSWPRCGSAPPAWSSALT
jgi:hypothetical protein